MNSLVFVVVLVLNSLGLVVLLVFTSGVLVVVEQLGLVLGFGLSLLAT